MRAPGPYLETIPIIWSTVMYCMENSSAFMPSFTLDRLGDDKSTIRRHFPGWPFFGMTPKLLTWRFGSGKRRGIKGTMEGDLRSGLFDLILRVGWKPNRKPCWSPFKTYETASRSGCPDKSLANSATFRELTTETGWKEGALTGESRERERKRKEKKIEWIVYIFISKSYNATTRAE